MSDTHFSNFLGNFRVPFLSSGVVDQSQLDDTGNFNSIGIQTGTSFYSLAQTFTPSVSGELSSFTISLAGGAGSPTGALTCSIYTDGTTAPLNLLGTAINSVQLPLAATAKYTYNFSGVILQANTIYWAVFELTQFPTVNNTYIQMYGKSSDAYSGGVAYRKQTSGWAAVGASVRDFYFSESYLKYKISDIPNPVAGDIYFDPTRNYIVGYTGTSWMAYPCLTTSTSTSTTTSTSTSTSTTSTSSSTSTTTSTSTSTTTTQ